MFISLILKLKAINQIRSVLTIAILICWPGAVHSAETSQYQAVLGENNQIELIPVPKDNQQEAGVGNTGAQGEIYMLQDASGVVKGLFPDKSTALARTFQPGDSMRVLATNYEFLGSGSIGLPAEKMEELAREASKKLLDAAKASACGFDPLPETISPTVEVSFSLFAGGSFSLQATWRTEDLCSPKLN